MKIYYAYELQITVCTTEIKVVIVLFFLIYVEIIVNKIYLTFLSVDCCKLPSEKMCLAQCWGDHIKMSKQNMHVFFATGGTPIEYHLNNYKFYAFLLLFRHAELKSGVNYIYTRCC